MKTTSCDKFAEEELGTQWFVLISTNNHVPEVEIYRLLRRGLNQDWKNKASSKKEET